MEPQHGNRPSAPPDAPAIVWTPYEVIAFDAFGGEALRIRIDRAGRVGRLLPACQLFLTILNADLRPLTARPLEDAAGAAALLARVQLAMREVYGTAPTGDSAAVIAPGLPSNEDNSNT